MLQSTSGALEGIKQWSSHPMRTLMCTKDMSTHFITFGIAAPWLFMWWWTTSTFKQGEPLISFSRVLCSSLINCLTSSAVDGISGIPIAELDLEEMEWSAFFGFNRPLKLMTPIVRCLYVYLCNSLNLCQSTIGSLYLVVKYSYWLAVNLSLRDLVLVR